MSKLNADELLCQSQTLWMSDADMSPQELFLKRRIVPHSITTLRSTVKPLNWELERSHREENRIQRTEAERKRTKTVKNYNPGDRIVIQDSIGKN